MFFALVRVHRRFTANGGIEFLNIRGRGFNYGAVGLVDAGIHQVESLKGGSKRIGQESKLPDRRLGLDTRAKDYIALPLAISLEADPILDRLEDVWFFGKRFLRRPIRFGRRSRKRLRARYGRGQGH